MGIIGKKIGMTQVFDEEGRAVPVTVVQAGPCVVVQKKTSLTDGYNALQLGFEPTESRKLNRPLMGHLKRAGVNPVRALREFRVDNPENFELGQKITVDELFKDGDRVDVSGVTRGKGFAGSIKRHNFNRGPMTHGSKYHRGPGSLSASADPSRVFKGRKLPGHMGATQATIQNLRVFRVDSERNLLLLEGAVPGPKGALLKIKATVKNRK